MAASCCKISNKQFKLDPTQTMGFDSPIHQCPGQKLNPLVLERRPFQASFSTRQSDSDIIVMRKKMTQGRFKRRRRSLSLPT